MTQVNAIMSPQSITRPDWEDESVFQRNRLPHRAYHLPDTKVCLNGKW